MAQKILVVDDEKDLRDALRTGLEASGFEVIEAENGELGFIAAENEKPDLILLDVMMPTLNGHHVLQRLRQTAWGKNLPVLLLTNADDPKNVAEGISLKSDDYVIKSQTSLKEIVVTIKQQLAGYK